MLNAHKNKIPVYIIAVLGGIIVYFISTSYKLGFSPDSVSYFEAANSLAKGNGYTNLNGDFINHWPPGYPVFIVIISRIFEVSSMLAGILGNSIIIFFTILLLYKLFKSFRIPDRFSYFLLTLYLCSPISYIYLWYLSEALFIPFILLSFLSFQKWLQTQNRINLILTSFLLGFSVMIRFAGLGFVAAYFIFLLIKIRNQSIKSIFSKVLTLLSGFILFVSPWLIYTNLQGTGSIDRNFDFKLIPLSKIQELLISFGSWIFGNLEGLLLVGASFIILTIIYYKPIRFSLRYIAINEEIKNEKIKLILSLGLTYVFFILFSAYFFDHAIPLSNRIFSPLYPFFLCSLGIFVGYISKHISRNLAFLIPAVMLVSYSFISIPAYYKHFKSGSGFTSVKFAKSPTIAEAEAKLKGKIIYTNDLFVLKIFSNFKEIKLLPTVKNSSSLRNISFEIIKGKAAIIYLDKVNWRNYIVSKESLLRSFESYRIQNYEDGIIISGE